MFNSSEQKVNQGGRKNLELTLRNSHQYLYGIVSNTPPLILGDTLFCFLTTHLFIWKPVFDLESIVAYFGSLKLLVSPFWAIVIFLYFFKICWTAFKGIMMAKHCIQMLSLTICKDLNTSNKVVHIKIGCISSVFDHCRSRVSSD